MSHNTKGIIPTSAKERINALCEALPEGGLFADKKWLLSPQPLALPQGVVAQLERLGHQLSVFQSAANTLYRQSVKGKAPGWLANYLDAGKPDSLVNYGRNPALREAVPRIIRPDLSLMTARLFWASDHWT